LRAELPGREAGEALAGAGVAVAPAAGDARASGGRRAAVPGGPAPLGRRPGAAEMTGGTEDVAHPRLGTRRLATGRRAEPGAGAPPRVAAPPDPAAGPARPAGLAGLRPGGDGPCRV